MNNLFGKKGLTSSEANHWTNVIKEMVRELNGNASDMKLSRTYSVVEGKEYALTSNKANPNWKSEINQIGELYSLSAWFKTAIKSKEAMLSALEEESRKINNLRYHTAFIEENRQPLIPLPPKPVVTFEAYLDTITTKERAEYYTNEAKAAHIGKFIHSFDDIRQKLDNFEETSITETKNGSIIINKHELLYNKKDLIEGFFDLQKAHREHEKCVNYWKACFMVWGKEMLDAHNEATGKVLIKNRNIEADVSALLSGKVSSRTAQIRKEKADISQYKIIIPNELQPTFTFVKEYTEGI